MGCLLAFIGLGLMVGLAGCGSAIGTGIGGQAVKATCRKDDYSAASYDGCGFLYEFRLGLYRIDFYRLI